MRTADPSAAAPHRRLTLRGVGRRYGIRGPWVLRGVDLDVPAGHLVRVRGANGTGKSTLLRLLAGIDAPGEGRVTGRPSRTAHVPERFPPALPFTVIGYLTHMGRVHGLARARARDAAGQWLERFGAAHYANTPLDRLSKGSSQKVAVAQALLAAPELLVLDEAWTGLDAAARDELDRAVAERTAAGGAVVFVDHDPSRLAGVPDAVYAIEGVRLRQVRDERHDGGGGVPPTRGHNGPRVVIEVSGPDGRAPDPGRLPHPHTVTRVDARTVRVTVPASHSDAALRALLDARPPWHVVGVRAASPADAVAVRSERP
ncbi:ABC transporter ATP-binding protein [Streptomyces beihaiensis]|uniref:ATP-binding cassette domain-containing protein n=1 Tax=Streptomyces beihaiensis TaxID=2984495 RepID=A0ABT3TVC7_9ACTN|nr:ATP-binding cassette domain-containing protein [Streptomyces beihaiensis]MCX3059953.1 ATP-binding cassette domain-containing protein [Streptomyces beihaiensis]